MQRARTALPFLLSVLFLTFLFLPSSLSQPSGPTFYVSNSDPTCGGRSPCYTTIQGAINDAPRASIIQIQPGTYRETLSIQGKNNYAGASESDRTIIQADPSFPPGSVVITNGIQVCTDGGAIQIKRSRFITIRGLTITGSGGPAISLIGGGINQNQAIHIERNRIFGNGNVGCDGGIRVVQESPGTLIVNNLIYGNGRNGISLISIGGGSHHIINNIIHANQWNGISIVQSQEIYLINNIITQNGVAGSTGSGFGLQREKSSKSTPQGISLLNNLICGNRLGEIDGPALDTTDSGNLTPQGTEGPGISASPGCEVPANVYAAINGTDALPNTVDDDFRLAVHSPGIDRGMDPRTLGFSILFNPLFEADFSTDAIRPSDGNADRTVAFDMGAFESANHPPTADAGRDQSALRGALVALDGTQSHDPDGAPLTFQWTVVAQPVGSGISLNNPTSTRPQFSPLFFGTYVFQLTVYDGEFNSAPDTVQVNVIDKAPAATSTTASTDEDIPVTITLSASDIDNPSLSFSIVAGPSNGTLSAISIPNCVANGGGSNCTATVTYTPASNYNGSDSLTFKVNDALVDSNIATVSITVNAVNDPPTASSVTASTNEETPVTITLSASDIDNPSLSFSIVAGPTHGTLGSISTPNCVANGTGSSCTATVTYAPVANYNGSDSLTFKVNDGSVDSNMATVTIAVNPMDDSPVAANDFYNTDKETPQSLFAPGVLGNDNDVDNTQGTLTAVLVSGPAHAENFMLNADGSFSYTPAQDFNGADTFTYKANDGSLDSNVATVTIAIKPANNAPVATNDFYNTDNETTLTVDAPGILANDNDIDTPISSLTATLVTGPSHAASFNLNPDGSFSYRPAQGFNGVDTFAYQANDGINDSNVAMVTIAMNPASNALVAQNDTYSSAEDTVLSEAAPGILSNDINANSNTLTASLVSAPAHATLFQLNADGSFSYTPAEDFNGVDTFTYRFFDGTVYSNVAMVQIRLTAINDRPVAQSQSVATNEDTPMIITLRASDVDSLTSSFAVVSGPSHGTLGAISTPNCAANGRGSICTATITYSPAAHYYGSDSFTFAASDGQIASNAAAVSITVNHVNHAPAANANGPYGGNVGDLIQFTGSGFDPDGDPITFIWDFGDGGTGSSQNPIHSYTAAGTFTVTLTVSDPFGASGASQTTATVIVGLAIATVSPGSGTVGTDVTIQGRGFDPTRGNTIVRFNGVQALITSITQTAIATFVPFNTATGRITVQTTQGTAASNDDFVVLLRQNFALSASPSIGVTVQGASTTYAIQIMSTGIEPFTGLADLTTGLLPAGVTATFTPSTLGPSTTGTLTLTTTNSTPVGSNTIELRATAQLEGYSNTRAAFITLGVQAPGQTILIGQVHDEQDQPLAGVSLKLGGAILTELGTSDAGGNFFIPLSMTGSQIFLIDGSSLNSPTVTYSTIPVTLDIQPGVVNNLGFIPHLHAQPVAKLMPITPGQATVVTTPDIPGFKMTIPSGVKIIGWDGQPNTQVGVTVIPDDRSPLPPFPPDLNSPQIYLFAFGKMGGGLPTGNIPIDTPNYVGGLPGDGVDLYYFNEAPDGTAPNQWEKYGTATVSSDGTQIITDINPATGLPYGIPRFCCGALRDVLRNQVVAGGGPSGGMCDAGKQDGEPVDTATGFFYLEKTDLVLSGILPIAITRTYRTQLTNAGVFGLGTSWPYDIFLQPPPNNSADALILYTPGNRQDLFARQANGSFINSTSPALKGAVVTIAGGLRTLRYKDGTLWRFDSPGRLISQVDRNGNSVTLTRDLQGRVTQITEPSGRQLILTYTGLNIRTDRIQDPIGRQVLYGYDSSGRLTTVTDAAGGITRYSYDTGNRMISITDPRGIIFLTNVYDSAGRVIRQTQADGGVWTFAYTTQGNFISQTTVTNPQGNKTTYRFNYAGYMVAQTDALGQTTNFERQPGTNLLLSTTDPLRRVTRFTYDGNGNMITITDPAGNIRSFEYGPVFNKITKITDPLGQIARFEYDAAGNLTAAIDPTGARTTIAYNSFGQPTSTTDAPGNMTAFTYDGNGNLVTIADPLGNKTQKAYDLVSRLIEQTDPRGRSTQFGYDGLNRVTQITDALSGLTQFSYDGNGNLLTVTDARGNTTHHTYDVMDRLSTRVDPLNQQELYQYDQNGNLVQTTDRKNQVTISTYDALDRRAKSNFADGTFTEFVYDAAGRLVEAKDSQSGAILQEYDVLDHLVRETTPQGMVAYTYDVLGRRTQMDVTGQAPVFYTYDPASRPTQVIQESQIVDLHYDVLGRRSQLMLPNGVSTEYTYDTASRLIELIYRNPAGILGNLTYQYDSAGNRVSVGGTFARTLLPEPVASAIYDAANRQIQFGDKQMTFDSDGNLASIVESSGTSTFTWDARNRLMGLSNPSTAASFSYDAFGRRLKKIINAQPTQYLYDDIIPTQEIFGGTVSAKTLTGVRIDEFLTRNDIASGVITNLLVDAVGNVIALADISGVIETEHTYEPFGRITASGVSTSNSFQYSGRENDGTGLYYFRARYYDPALQRFVSEDPIKYADKNFNLYSYVANNPINYTDPLGTTTYCGSGWNSAFIPDSWWGKKYDFSSACKKHDDCYGTCGRSKEICDQDFYTNMVIECKKLNGFWAEDCMSTALTYYGAVKKFGAGAYKNAQKEITR